eukprot:scaffold178_cov255-Pinguiococcus_pyrenoidosus.AAC.16
MKTAAYRDGWSDDSGVCPRTPLSLEESAMPGEISAIPLCHGGSWEEMLRIAVSREERIQSAPGALGSSLPFSQAPREAPTVYCFLLEEPGALGRKATCASVSWRVRPLPRQLERSSLAHSRCEVCGSLRSLRIGDHGQHLQRRRRFRRQTVKAGPRDRGLRLGGQGHSGESTKAVYSNAHLPERLGYPLVFWASHAGAALIIPWRLHKLRTPSALAELGRRRFARIRRRRTRCTSS